MTSPYDLMVKLQEVRNNILEQVEIIVYRNENNIIKLNTTQIDEHIGFDGSELQNTNKLFSGFYRKNFFSELGDFKQAGELYDFTNTGNFFKGFYVDVMPNLTQIEIGSTGTGSGDKADFFRGYNNIFGLTNKNQYILNYEIILPELQEYVKSKIG